MTNVTKYNASCYDEFMFNGNNNHRIEFFIPDDSNDIHVTIEDKRGNQMTMIISKPFWGQFVEMINEIKIGKSKAAT